MHVNSRDIRPVSMLEQSPVSRSMLIGGVLGVVLAHLGAPLAFFAIMAALAASGLASTKPETFVEEHIVEARFVRLGEIRDPEKLPDRKVPPKATAPDDSTVVSKVNEPPPPQKPDAGVRQAHAEEDSIRRLTERAEAFAEIEQQRELEGDPNGVEDGTETEAQAGDIYAGQLREFFKRGWTIPTTLGDTSKLVSVVSVEITTQLKVGPFEVTRGSGEALFDQSIEDRINELKTLGTTVPEPPPEVAAKFLGRSITLNFRGRGLE